MRLQAPLKQLVLLLALFCHHVSGSTTEAIDQLEWALKKDSNGIQIYTAKIPHSVHKAILSVTTIEADINTIVNIIRTPSTCTQWAYRCHQSYLHEQLTEHEYIVYTANNMPFPVRNRDIVAHIKWETDPTTHVIRATGVAIKDTLPKTKRHVRIEEAKMIWELTPLTKESTKVRSYTHANPASRIPAWLTNQLATNIPLKTMQGLKKLANNKQTRTK